MKAHEVCQTAAHLVGQDRAKTHGDKVMNHQNIADLWSAYLVTPITALDVALMMALLKIARTKSGSHNPDDYVDLAGYAGCAGEIAADAAGRTGSVPSDSDRRRTEADVLSGADLVG